MSRRVTSTAELNAMSKRRASGLSTEEIRIVKARSPFAWLRPVLLLLGLLAIGAVLLMLAAYRFGRGAEDAADGQIADRSAAQDGEQILVGEGFEFTQTSEGVALFRIRAEQSQKDRDGTSYLTTVDLDVYRQDGQTYTVRSKHARVNETTWEARLEGDVKLSGWDKLELEARALEFREEGQVLESVGEVQFRYPPEFVGRASHLKVDRQNDTVTLSDGVHLHTVAGAPRPMRLDCERLVFQRSTGILRAVGDASIKSDQQALSAHYLTLFLAADGRTLESVRARWNVLGRGTVESGLGDVTTVEYRGEFLDVQPDPLEPGSRRIKLDGEGEDVTLSVTDLSGLKRVFTGLYIVGRERGDRLVQMEGVGDPVSLLETLDFDEPFPLRQVCAERITARFLATGGISRVQLEKRVELHDTDVSMSGGRKASLNMEDGSFRVEGPEVLLSSPRGEVTSSQFTWNREKGLIRARSGVRAVLADKSLRALRGTPLGQGSGPVQVDAAEAYWTSEPPTFTFEGDVRAWRGESLLLADQLRGDEREQKLAASGNVRSVWVPTGAGSPGGVPGEPIEVRAGRLSYLDGVSRLVYEKDVELRQGRRTIQCQELSVELEQGGRARQMTCNGEVKMVDPESGKRVQGGDRAVYTLAEELVEIFGDQVELYDAENNKIRGRYVLYDLRAGTFKIRSRADGAGAESP